MRPSTTVLLFAFAGSACATSESIDPSATRGSGMLFDGGLLDTGTGMGTGAEQGAGGFSAGGFPSAGGFIANGGVPARGGSKPAGGASPTAGGSPNTGGAPPVTGGRPNGGSSGSPPQGGAAGTCQTTEKVCGGVCVRAAPANGCGPQGCTACSTPAPSNGILACNNGQCDFNCLSGFTKTGSSCVGATSGGDGGGTCNPATCPACTLGAKPCCGSPTRCSCDLLGICL